VRVIPVSDDDIFVPSDDDSDPEAEALMQQGKASGEHDPNNLRDPWFHTDEGRAWLAERGK
jgi:hypothetical protein